MENLKYDLAPVIKSVEDDLADIDEAAGIINAMQIKSQADLETAVQFTASIKESYADIDGKRESWVKPLKGVIDSINETFKPALMALEVAEEKLKTKINVAVLEADTKRTEILKQVEAADETARPVLLVKADEYVRDKVSGLSFRKAWKGKIVDKKKIIDWCIKTGQFQFLSINEGALKAVTKELGGGTDIPGWEVWEDRTVAISVDKVKK
jgi:hypothetical protein